MSVDVKVYDLEDTDETRVKRVLYVIPEGSGMVSDKDRLFQQIVKSLLTTPGSDKFNPGWGGGLHTVLPIMIEDNQISPSSRDNIFFSVSKVKDDIIRYQIKNPEPIQSSLRALSVADLRLEEDGLNENVILYLTVKTADDKTAIISVEV